jgi:hypothetical protein
MNSVMNDLHNLFSAKQSNNQPLVGSYAPEDCLFLLKPIKADYKTIENKEQLIQSGQLHYSEMIHKESAPTEQYTDLFYSMTELYKVRLAREVMRLAKMICEQRRDNITLISLARAGTPIGVLLQRALTQFYHKKSNHFSISIIRDRGIDEIALDYLLAQGFSPESIVFVDGWTAKGVITKEVHQSIKNFNQSRNVNVSDELFVISDIGGTADVQATFDDYTIPSALMNSTVSGLISRSILNDQIGEGDFHGCVPYLHLKEYDLSNWFVDIITAEMKQDELSPECVETKQFRQKMTQHFLNFIMEKYSISDINRIKPGIAEATRVLLRRVPDQLLIRSLEDENVAHLKRLAYEKNIPVTEVKDMPFGACALIKDVLNLSNLKHCSSTQTKG